MEYYNTSILRAGRGHDAVTEDLQRHVLRLCATLRPDAVALVDAVAPPDFCLKSVLGSSDGEVSRTKNYRHLRGRNISYLYKNNCVL